MVLVDLGNTEFVRIKGARLILYFYPSRASTESNEYELTLNDTYYTISLYYPTSYYTVIRNYVTLHRIA